MPTVNVKVNQKFYAIMDPQWGAPVVIPETIRERPEAAKDAVLWLAAHSIYHGGSIIMNTQGNWAGLAEQGYKVVEFDVTQVQTEVLKGTHTHINTKL